MNMDEINNVEDINRLKEQYNNEIIHLDNELKSLEAARRNNDLAVGEYERELESINNYKEKEEKKLEELLKLEESYNNILTNLVALHNLAQYSPKDEYEKKAYQEELEARQNEINANMELLNTALIGEIQEEVNRIFNLDEKKETKEEQPVQEEKVEEVKEELSDEETNDLENKAAVMIQEMNELKDRVASIEDADELEKLKEEIQSKAVELDEISSKLTNQFSKEIEEMYEEDKINQEIDIENLSDQAINDINSRNAELVKLREELAELEEARKESIVNFKKIFNEERINTELNGPFNAEDQDRYFNHYMNLKIEEDERLKDINKKLKRIHNRIKKLEKEKKDVIKHSEESLALEIPYDEYMIIYNLLETGKDKKITELFEKRGLGEIVHKKGGRTNEEKAKLQEAREEIYKEVLEYKEKYENLRSIEEIIDIMMEEDLGVLKQEEEPKQLKLTPQEKDNIERNLGIIINGDVYISGDVNIIINEDGAKTLSLGNMEIDNNTPEAVVEEEDELPFEQTANNDGLENRDSELEDLPLVTEEPTPDIAMEQEDQIPFVPTTPNVPLLTGEVLEDENNMGDGNPDNDNDREIDDVPYLDNTVKDEGNDGLSDEEDLNDDDLDNDYNVADTNDTPTVPSDGDSTSGDDNTTDEPIIEVTPEEPEIKAKRGIREIIKDIRKDHEIGKKDGQRYRRSNLKVSKTFLEELKSGDYLYNIVHFIPGLVKAGASFISKLTAKLTTTQAVKDRMEDMKKNIDALPIEDIEVLWEEFRGNFITQERYPQALTMIIQEKLQEYAMGKVEAINIEITNAYRQVFTGKTMLDAIDKKLATSMTMEERRTLLAQREKILQTIVENIDLIREKKVEGNQLLSGGLQGLNEDIRARNSKMNYVGFRFAKEYDLDKELEDQLTAFEKAENRGRATGDNQAVLDAFLGQEFLLEENTEVSKSIFGERTTGKKQHSPLAEALNYSQDPFIRDLFTTIAFTTAAVGAINAFNVHKAAQEQAARVDAANAGFEKTVHTKGQELVDQSPIFRKGMKAQANEDVLAGSNSLERQALDQSAINSGSWMGGNYSQLDAANHQAFEAFGDSTRQTLSDISSRLSSGGISQTDALREMVQLQQQTQSTLTSMLTKCYQTLQTYRGVKPQFDLDAPERAMEFLINHSNSINDMNNAMLNSVDIGQDLLGLSAEMVGELPSDLLTTLTACASSALLAYRVSSTMSAKYGNNKYHRNAVTDMFEDYGKEDELEEEQTKTR